MGHSKEANVNLKSKLSNGNHIEKKTVVGGQLFSRHTTCTNGYNRQNGKISAEHTNNSDMKIDFSNLDDILVSI